MRQQVLCCAVLSRGWMSDASSFGLVMQGGRIHATGVCPAMIAWHLGLIS
jgi:hypothetical protein